MKKIDQRNYFVVIDDSEEMWTAVKFATKRAKTTKSNLTTISFIESISDGMMLTPSTEKILDKEQLSSEKIKHKEVQDFIFKTSKIKAKSEIFKINEIDDFINFRAICLSTADTIPKAKAWYDLAAQQNCPEALFRLANMHWTGVGVQADNRIEACELWHRAVLLGHRAACEKLRKILKRQILQYILQSCIMSLNIPRVCLNINGQGWFRNTPNQIYTTT